MSDTITTFRQEEAAEAVRVAILALDEAKGRFLALTHAGPCLVCGGSGEVWIEVAEGKSECFDKCPVCRGHGGLDAGDRCGCDKLPPKKRCYT